MCPGLPSPLLKDVLLYWSICFFLRGQSNLIYYLVLSMDLNLLLSLCLDLLLCGQARGLDGNVTLIVGDNPQQEFVRSARNIVGVKVLEARVRKRHSHLS